MERLRYIINLLIVSLMLLTVAINRNGKIAGTPINDLIKSEGSADIPDTRKLKDGTLVVNSLNIAKNISGYGGTTPVEIYIKEGQITDIKPLNNSETPDFMNVTLLSGILSRWNGLTPKEAIKIEVDAVSGATFTSLALIGTIHQTLQYIAGADPLVITNKNLTPKSIMGLLVILSGVVLSFVAKSKIWRTIQLFLNVIVLGFWCGSFLSISQFVSWLSNGINIGVALIPFSLLVVALILPFAIKRNQYCAWHCPMGSLQELMGKCTKNKLSVPPVALKYLNYLREIILLSLLFTMWIGFGFSLMDYELFAAFIFNSASTGIITATILFLILSLFVSRPYCRFICPTGALLKYTLKTKID